jgi:hypothetical protein
MTQPDAQQQLIFVHLSDIHFISDIGKYDIDSGLRDEIEKDSGRLIEEGHIDHVDGILVSGDIAFAGKVEEYERARKWLEKLTALVGCDPSYVWCVPGNHDVDQSVQTDMPTLLDTYAALRSVPKHSLDDDLRKRLLSRESGPLMFQPLKTYNEQFAARFGCSTSPRELYWEDDLPLNDGSILRIRGLNSALISSRLDHENTSKLLLGTVQTQYRSENNIAYLTLCHHPPDWLIDGESAHRSLTTKSQLQLFGHKHRDYHEVINETLRLSSGAVHPVRSERGWEPRYYFIALRVNGAGTTRELEIRLFPRVWNETKFTRAAGDFEGQFVTIRLKLPNWEPSSNNQEKPAPGEKAKNTEMDIDRKKTVNRFMSLSYHSQLSIMRKLGLFKEEERESISDTELFISCFARAREKGVLDKVWELIEQESSKSEV